MNKVCLTGRITRDPEIKYSQSGMSMLGFVLAVDRMQKDANGQKQADFITCKAFGGNADFISRFCHKGNMLGIDGHIQTGSYTNSAGATVYTTDVYIDRVENLTPRELSATNPQPSATQQQGYQNPQYGQQQRPQAQQQAPNQFNVTDDDVPF